MDEETQQSSEIARRSVRAILQEGLKGEFVEGRIGKGNRWPESEADELRAVLNTRSEEEAGRAVAESKIYLKWKEINERNFSGEDLAMVTMFSRFLNVVDGGQDHGALLFSLEESLHALKEQRMRALGVSEEAIAEDRAHTRAVAEKMPHGIGTIMAILHDVSKYSAVEDGGGVRQVRNVGIHEATSAILAGEILREALLGEKTVAWLNSIYGDVDIAYGYTFMARTAIEFMESVIAVHGHQEFPMKVSKGRPLPEVEGAYVYQPVPVMPKEVYLGEYRTLQSRIMGEVNERDLAACQVFYEGLREADMMVGIDPYSFVKYFNEASPQRVFGMDSVSAYVHTFAGTALEYLRDAPNVLGLRERSEVDDVNTKVGLLFTVMHATETLEADAFEVLASSVGAELSSPDKEAMVGIFRQALDLHQSFRIYKTLVFEKDEMSEALKVQVKKDMATKFAFMVKNLMDFEYHKLKSLSFNTAIAAHMKDLEDRFTRN
ncbi:MAG: hypothetical protein KatS3mg087_0780 [Patescibacteria group bacterium]|nr:MAG: hypothetical protein KatS3mg087_0780 [Patescibacteria group bacterium]